MRKLVKVIWEDAWGRAGWSREADVEGMEVESIGYLLARNKKGILLAQGLSEDGAALGIGFIPHGMIKKLRRLKDVR